MLFRKTILHFSRMALIVTLVTATAGADRPSGGDRPRIYGAREIAALSDMAAMRDAEVIAYLDTGCLHPLEDLNDLLSSQTNYYFDNIMDGGGAQTISTITGRFYPQRVDVRWSPHVWGGPYLTYQQGRFSIDGAGYDPGTPLDPWDNPYYLFTPLGLVRPTLGMITLELYGDAFDRYAIVSLGNDGVMSDDDIILKFEGSTFGPPTLTTISSLVPAAAIAGQRVTVRGYNFGGTQGASRLELAGAPVTLVSWGDRAIAFDVPARSSGGEVVVVRATQRSNAFLLRVLVGARHWSLYR
jgi:hypothetical protein